MGVTPSRCALNSGKVWLDTGSPASAASAAARSQPLTPPTFMALSIRWSEARAAIAFSDVLGTPEALAELNRRLR